MIGLLLASGSAFLFGWIMASRRALPDYERLLRTAREYRDAQEERRYAEIGLYARELRKVASVLTEARQERDLYLDLWKGTPLAETRWSRAGKPLPDSLTDCLKGDGDA